MTILDLYGTLDPNQLLLAPVSSSLKHILNIFFIHKPLLLALPLADFSVNKLYNLLHHTGQITPFKSAVWETKAPSKVSFFIWLLFKDKLLTQNNLLKRGWPAPPNCLLCHSGEVKDAAHLFSCCMMARNIWTRVSTHYSLPPFNFTSQPFSDWQTSRSLIQKDRRKEWSPIWAATVWNIWKTRNACVFSQSQVSTHRLLSSIVSDVRLWNLYI
ncbi:RNA-directed DNA polymerase (reverse transcriptase)-related family protein [Rhynchospora pubera]|uniref:RNA-directed DNA polymerase (Reverse transcriptase)-related family protein n=1 Tax=Rhynchospora pubera TaxID=906938 RepID=A0AAV8GAN2_9POAL|nr:RNA-directed DNA polymerase (reverse transcriptase)-related family protein [Rhynchospora pubera]